MLLVFSPFLSPHSPLPLRKNSCHESCFSSLPLFLLRPCDFDRSTQCSCFKMSSRATIQLETQNGRPSAAKGIHHDAAKVLSCAEFELHMYATACNCTGTAAVSMSFSHTTTRFRRWYFRNNGQRNEEIDYYCCCYYYMTQKLRCFSCMTSRDSSVAPLSLLLYICIHSNGPPGFSFILQEPLTSICSVRTRNSYMITMKHPGQALVVTWYIFPSHASHISLRGETITAGNSRILQHAPDDACFDSAASCTLV